MEDKKQRGLRKGYTTGTCAAAASKAAAIAFLTKKKVKGVEVTLPVGKAVNIPVHRCEIESERAIASVIKDAGDDPDVTNGAEVVAEVSTSAISNFKFQISNFKRAFQFTVHDSQFTVFGGKGIGIVTKPGLAIPIGEPAINPVPRKMIEEAIREAISNFKFQISNFKFSVTISVPNGEEIAKKTMNARLGIIGGISILGTTGIVEPVSLSAYRDSITCAIDVAKASGCNEIVFSTGRSSEKVVEQIIELPEEAFILVGDHMGFALKNIGAKCSGGQRVKKIIIVGQFGKFSKLAAGHFETHCSDSSIELEFLAHLAKEAGAKKDIFESVKNANTARHVFFMLKEQGLESVYKTVCNKVKENAGEIIEGEIDIGCMLIGYDNEVVERV
ncbi:MAG: cobalamin biosynthesis protein CbiD [Deltaproteobacteria bacterium]|nr:cobalamin biosynthesis protein CbiD [Deltaproteobacteria bacterium]